jgi:uncharacterized protein (TIGR03643 family)
MDITELESSQTSIDLTIEKLVSQKEFTLSEIDRIIQMAWEDRTPFEAIEVQFGLKEKDVIKLMRSEMQLSSFKMWRKRMKTRKVKHISFAPDPSNIRFKSDTQRNMYFHKTRNKGK